MPYLIDRKEALRLDDVVIILNVRERRVRSRVIQRDNSLYRTLSRAGTLRRRVGVGWGEGQLRVPNSMIAWSRWAQLRAAQGARRTTY